MLTAATDPDGADGDGSGDIANLSKSTDDLRSLSMAERRRRGVGAFRTSRDERRNER